MVKGKVELMAPAGSFESLQAAIDNGADSVYFGVEQLNMRARSSINFTIEDLTEIQSRCEAKGVSYLYHSKHHCIRSRPFSYQKNMQQSKGGQYFSHNSF